MEPGHPGAEEIRVLMILSFHPLFTADRNRLCAGRSPDRADRRAMAEADAVILPQGCGEALYVMARKECPNVFPNYDARFRFPGKRGQIRLFRDFGAPHPRSATFGGPSAFREPDATSDDLWLRAYPLVFKFDWGGEGEGVFLLESESDLQAALDSARSLERSGMGGFLLQEFVATGSRTLRVAVIGKRIEIYWRIDRDGLGFGTSLARGAEIDRDADPDLMAAGRRTVERLCLKTGINLAGFDLIFRDGWDRPEPLFLEINYFFGRRGLGGSERYYGLVDTAIRHWLSGLDRDAGDSGLSGTSEWEKEKKIG